MEQIKDQTTGRVVAVFCVYHCRWEVVSSNFTVASNINEEDECALVHVDGLDASIDSELTKFKSALLDRVIDGELSTDDVESRINEHKRRSGLDLGITHFTKLSELMSYLIFHGLYSLSGLRGFKFDTSRLEWTVLND